MPKFDMSAAWDDTLVLLRSYSGLTWAIAAVFLFLPTLAVSWFGPTPIEPPAGATFDQIMLAMRENLRQVIPYQILVGLISAIGGVGILRLWLSRSGVSVGEALRFALTMAPTMIAVQVMLGLMIGFSALLLILPALYLWGRFAVVAPVVADRSERNPFAALGQGWALTKGNGWRIFLFLFLVALVTMIAAIIFGGVVAAVSGTNEGVGHIVSGFVEGGVAAVAGMVTLAVTAATYRQLAMRDAGDVFG